MYTRGVVLEGDVYFSSSEGQWLKLETKEWRAEEKKLEGWKEEERKRKSDPEALRIEEINRLHMKKQEERRRNTGYHQASWMGGFF